MQVAEEVTGEEKWRSKSIGWGGGVVFKRWLCPSETSEKDHSSDRSK